ncbi:hypothetical protein [Alloyangia pacifica]|uniref:Uncharacterized protein n=1 Tax=Alloyangia pacifica TaxID=311180 RepID=A0A1I6QIR5_9RHOB|nr:hypothetical protein [Alloyangia pacifica]SDF90634.1 hypothetical protein SAMN04488245_10196 [Alloyangia pacifica]SFS52245.1 hypothetical protein SAMN04488050_10297 [Alloyangia pacifica]
MRDAMDEIDRLSDVRDRARQQARADLGTPISDVFDAIACEAENMIRTLRRAAKTAEGF